MLTAPPPARRLLITCSALLLGAFTAPAARGQAALVLDESLQGGASADVRGGAFADGGWKVVGPFNCVIWHVPTVGNGAVEWSMKGVNPNECRSGLQDICEIFQMYDWTFGDSDNTYFGNFRICPYKHMINKTSCWNPAKVDSFEVILGINGAASEPDTGKMTWDPSVTYRFREEWGTINGECVFSIYRDGVWLTSWSVPGRWTPGGHAVRIGASPRSVDNPTSESGAPVDAIYSNVKVWDFAKVAPSSPAPPPAVPATVPTVGIAGDKFTINGQPTFLLGASYFDARFWRVSDLDALAGRGFNLIRVWLDWDVKSFFDANGNLVHQQSLIDLVRACAARGIVVDVTILDPGLTFDPARREQAVRAAVAALKNEPNVFFDVMNEHEHSDGPITHAQVKTLIAAAKAENPNAIVTVSSAGDHLLADLTLVPSNIDAELAAGIDALTPHLSRTADWADKTDQRVAALKNYLASKGRNIPVYLQEEARRGASGLNPTAAEFTQAATEARNAGAAAWIFHTDAGFSLSVDSFFNYLDAESLAAVDQLGPAVFGTPFTPPPPAPAPAPAPVATDDAQAVSDTIPASMIAGRSYPVTITMRNSGTTTWQDNQVYKLGAVNDSDPFAGARQYMAAGETVAPGATKTFSFTMIAPTTAGTYTTDWQMVHEMVRWFGQTKTKQVAVASATVSTAGGGTITSGGPATGTTTGGTTTGATTPGTTTGGAAATGGATAGTTTGGTTTVTTYGATGTPASGAATAGGATAGTTTAAAPTGGGSGGGGGGGGGCWAGTARGGFTLPPAALLVAISCAASRRRRVV